MTLEIWSDIACPFCYLGKRRFEAALAQFEHRKAVNVVWRSFQLDPEAPHFPDRNIYEYLSERKGWSVEQARQMNLRVAETARADGLVYDFDRLVPANTFDAHRLTHLAARFGKQAEAEERLFAAYFSEGKNVADHAVLQQAGEEIGLPAPDVEQMLAGKDFVAAVHEDLETAAMLRIHGVPFFVFERRYAVSGAQATAEFLRALRQVWQTENPAA